MSDYRDHASKRTCIEILQRHVLDTYVRGDTPALKTAICEELPRGDSEIPQEVWLDIFKGLQEWEQHYRVEMNKYRFQKVEGADGQLPMILAATKSAAPEDVDADSADKKTKAKKDKSDGEEAAVHEKGAVATSK